MSIEIEPLDRCQFADILVEENTMFDKVVEHLNQNANPNCYRAQCANFDKCKALADVAIAAVNIRIAVQRGGELNN